MQCSLCGSETRVLSTRKVPGRNRLARRRECCNADCKGRFSTMEGRTSPITKPKKKAT